MKEFPVGQFSTEDAMCHIVISSFTKKKVEETVKEYWTRINVILFFFQSKRQDMIS